ncbi:hypothetical protein [Nonomuraea dietziae]|uniref:hypothetical protein n=1 Tax=Nonomuraea dietziae TaxID=65515 RepID=UPI00340C213B
MLLSPVVPGASEADLLERARAVGEVLPVVGFYLQTAIGGPVLSRRFWRELAEQPSTIAVKVAAFDRYRTLDVAHAVAASGRADQVVLHTGNDDHIVGDLLADLPGGLRFSGGLLGQWAVWTRAAVDMVAGLAKDPELWAGRAAALTDANAAVFDAANGFAGCIAGVHEVLQAATAGGDLVPRPGRRALARAGRGADQGERRLPVADRRRLRLEHLDDWLG